MNGNNHLGMMPAGVTMVTNSTRHTLFIIFIFLLLPGGLWGQQKDFQSWWKFSMAKGLNKGIDLSCDIEQRFRNNSLQYDQSLLTIIGEYEVFDYLSVATGARIYVVQNQELALNVSYRLHLDAIGQYSLSGFELSYRIRFQYGFDDFHYFNNIPHNNLGFRNRLKVDRYIFGTKLGAFAFTESFQHWNEEYNRSFYKIRFSAGAFYTPGFRSKFSLRYMLDSEFNVANPMQYNILQLVFAYDL